MRNRRAAPRFLIPHGGRTTQGVGLGALLSFEWVDEQERFTCMTGCSRRHWGLPPWFVARIRFDEASKVLTAGIEYGAASCVEVEGVAGAHPVHDPVTKAYRYLNFFQHECVREVRTPRAKTLGRPPAARTTCTLRAGKQCGRT